MTELLAVCPITGQLLKWAGQDIEAESEIHALSIAQSSGMGYLKITGLRDSIYDIANLYLGEQDN